LRFLVFVALAPTVVSVRVFAVAVGMAACRSACNALFVLPTRQRAYRCTKMTKTCSILLKIRHFPNFQQNFRVLGQVGLPRRLAPIIAFQFRLEGAATARKGA